MPSDKWANHTSQYRKESKYTVEEQKVIEPYKDAFRDQQSKAGRLQILKCDILPNVQLLEHNWEGPKGWRRESVSHQGEQ